MFYRPVATAVVGRFFVPTWAGMMTMGSLFSGIGGFELAGARHGIQPLWASEVEPTCIGVTMRHFPQMEHLGDIKEVRGDRVQPVDVVTFGSPCQDLSVASGARVGLGGERSGLFGEAIHIIGEMVGASGGRYPTWAVWENVPGVLSSGNGMDFRTILQCFTDNTNIPMPNSGRWAGAGMVRGGRCDLAWRVLDAQFWGVPQRRRRVFLVADFTGQRATEVLFKPEGLCWHTTQGKGAWEGVAQNAGKGFTPANDNGRTHANDNTIWPKVAGTLSSSGAAVRSAGGQGNETDMYVAGFLGQQGAKSNIGYHAQISPTLKHTGESSPSVVYACKTDQTTGNGLGICVDTTHTLDCGNGQAIAFRRHQHGGYTGGVGTICESGGDMGGGSETIITNYMTVRRLTPIECERLQGFPDNWTAFDHKDKPIKDSRRYSALGNSVAIPCVEYIMQGIADCD